MKYDKYQVCDINYDLDGDEGDTSYLPEILTIDVPDDLDEDEVYEFISDEISNMTGFCHNGFTSSKV